MSTLLLGWPLQQPVESSKNVAKHDRLIAPTITHDQKGDHLSKQNR